MTGIALPLSELPARLHRVDAVTDRVYVRAGVLEEVQFHWWQEPAMLPVRWDGRLELLRWGSKDRRSPLPLGGWVPEDRVEALAGARPERVVVPARFGWDNGAWFAITTGVHGVAVRVRGGSVVYLLTRAPTNYYRNLTQQQPAMPLFVGQVI
jgi:hypothetical protein